MRSNVCFVVVVGGGSTGYVVMFLFFVVVVAGSTGCVVMFVLL